LLSRTLQQRSYFLVKLLGKQDPFNILSHLSLSVYQDRKRQRLARVKERFRLLLAQEDRIGNLQLADKAPNFPAIGWRICHPNYLETLERVLFLPFYEVR